jgi:hypothetical protein
MNSKMMLFGALVGVVALALPVVAVDAKTCVGIVMSYEGSNEHYTIKHHGRDKPISLLMPLYEGDKLVLNCAASPARRVTLELNQGKKDVECRDSPYVLTKIESYNLFSNISDFVWSKIANLVNDLHEERSGAQLASLAGRPVAPTNPRLFSPVLGRSGSRMSAGNREFFLAWAGGKPPYAVRLTSVHTGRALAHSRRLREPRAHLRELRLDEGRYHVRISDADGQSLERSIDVVPASALPEHPLPTDEGVVGVRDTQLRDTIYAAWLLDQNRRLWSLEAYQRVAGLAHDNYPAQLLRQKLEGSL